MTTTKRIKCFRLRDFARCGYIRSYITSDRSQAASYYRLEWHTSGGTVYYTREAAQKVIEFFALPAEVRITDYMLDEITVEAEDA